MNEILQAIREKQPSIINRPFIIAISGFGGSGKSTLAQKLNESLENSAVVSIDSFALDHLSKRSADWEGLDFTRFRTEVLEPASRNEVIRYGVYDWAQDTVTHTEVVTPQTYLIVEGCGIFQPELLPYYDYSIWVDVPLEEATKRGITRDRAQGATWDENWYEIWMPNEKDFFDKYHPDKVANFIFKPN